MNPDEEEDVKRKRRKDTIEELKDERWAVSVKEVEFENTIFIMMEKMGKRQKKEKYSEDGDNGDRHWEKS